MLAMNLTEHNWNHQGRMWSEYYHKKISQAYEKNSHSIAEENTYHKLESAEDYVTWYDDLWYVISISVCSSES